MERIRALNGYQKGVLVVLLVMVVVFSILYPINMSREGYLYNETILLPSEQDGATVYSGKITGKEVKFTVTGNTVVLEHGDTTYGPYTVTEDPTAVPEDEFYEDRMTGVEIRCGDEIFFRGGMMMFDDTRWMYGEDGGSPNVSVSFRGQTDWMEPTAYDIMELVEGPALTHKGNGEFWFLGVVACAITAVLVLFADELFRFQLQFSIRNVEDAEPSEWEMMGRYVAWTLLPVVALFVFMTGLESA